MTPDKVSSVSEELKPCPFCGDSATVSYWGTETQIMCTNCNALSAAFSGEDAEQQATAAWNTRSSAPRTSEDAAWQPITTVRTDGRRAQLWHELWGVPIVATYHSGLACPWIEATATTRWPMEAFTHWRDPPEPPNIANTLDCSVK